MTQIPISGDVRLSRVAHRFGGVPFAVTVFLSASLVFLVQPMFARMATPLLGGSPNVWSVSLVCFQAALLAGYAYTHALTHFVKSVRLQVLVHAVLLALAALVLPFQLTGMFGSPDPSQPTLWLVKVFAVSIAPPFAIISATAPLIQAWYARTGRADAHDPYHLYAASNAGSLFGLAAYPLLLEPLAPLAIQTGTWSSGYLLLTLMLILCGLVAARSSQAVQPFEQNVAPKAHAVPASLWKQRLWWLALAFVPSSLLVGVTTHIVTDVASAPFLWAPPLMLYIGSFIIVFSKRPLITTAQAVSVAPLLAGFALFTLSKMVGVPTLLSFCLHLAALFVAAVACHGLLAADRPDTSRLTEFYLLMSLGGVLGGAFNALLVPVLFTTVAEYPLMLIAMLFLLPQPYWLGSRRLWILAGVALAAAIVSISVRNVALFEANERTSFLILLSVSLVMFNLVRSSRICSAVAAAALWMISDQSSPTSGSYSERGFFGVVQVQDDEGYRLMVHGTTLHGAQAIGEDALRPATYYAPDAPIGEIFAANDGPGRVGVIGLGVGSVACYARPDQQYTFYEIDPVVARLARDPERFTFLSECTPDATFVLGDGRLTLADEPEAAFGLLLVDAFSSDSVPAHLLTREALALYLSRVDEDGILLLHVSNRHMALETVVARIAGELGVPARGKFHASAIEGEESYRSQSSTVVVLAHNEEALAAMSADAGWRELKSDGGRVWTDDYSNIPGAIMDRLVYKKP